MRAYRSYLADYGRIISSETTLKTGLFYSQKRKNEETKTSIEFNSSSSFG